MCSGSQAGKQHLYLALKRAVNKNWKEKFKRGVGKNRAVGLCAGDLMCWGMEWRQSVRACCCLRVMSEKVPMVISWSVRPRGGQISPLVQAALEHVNKASFNVVSHTP